MPQINLLTKNIEFDPIEYLGPCLLHFNVIYNFFFSSGNFDANYSLPFLFRMLNDVAEVVLGPSSAPESPIFKQMTKVWLEVDSSKKEALISKNNNHTKRKNDEDFSELIDFGINYLSHSKKKGFREDYREMICLALLLVDAYPSDLGTYHVRSIGAICNARWMHRVLCIFKLILFRSQFIALNIIALDEMKKIEELSLFLIKFYVRQWLSCPIGADAAVNDLALFCELSKVKSTSSHFQFANPMLRQDAHLWFTSEELVVLSLLSEKLSNAEKARCAKAMIKLRRTPSDCSVSPGGKLHTPILKENTKIWELFGPRSWLLLNLLGIGSDDNSFLDKPVKDWKNQEDFLLFKTAVSNIKVVNDSAERGILLAKTVQGKLTRNEQDRKNLILTVQHVRDKIESVTKKCLLSFRI